MLVTAGEPASFNTMTASWGGLGVIWAKNVCFSVIRPVRYTYTFIERSDTYSPLLLRRQVQGRPHVCGTKSGRETEKVAETGLTPVLDDGPINSEEARLVFQCRKLFSGPHPRELQGPRHRCILPAEGLPQIVCGRNNEVSGPVAAATCANR